jgi:hypothetical protein
LQRRRLLGEQGGQGDEGAQVGRRDGEDDTALGREGRRLLLGDLARGPGRVAQHDQVPLGAPRVQPRGLGRLAQPGLHRPRVLARDRPEGPAPLTLGADVEQQPQRGMQPRVLAWRRVLGERVVGAHAKLAHPGLKAGREQRRHRHVLCLLVQPCGDGRGRAGLLAQLREASVQGCEAGGDAGGDGAPPGECHGRRPDGTALEGVRPTGLRRARLGSGMGIGMGIGIAVERYGRIEHGWRAWHDHLAKRGGRIRCVIEPGQFRDGPRRQALADMRLDALEE